MNSSNLLHLKNPELYRCRVRRYTQGHSSMYLWVVNTENTDDRFFLIFSPVQYFSGQMRWQGANFSQASNDTMLTIARKVDHLNRYSDDELIENPKRLKLYEFELPHDTIQILAGGFTQTNSSDIDFK